MTQQWLNCSIVKGMFSDELAVTYKPLSGSETSVFVPKRLVETGPNNVGRVMVEVFKSGTQTWAVLPNESREEVLVGDNDISLP